MVTHASTRTPPGDAGAVLVERHAALVLGVVRRRLHPRHPDFDDCLQAGRLAVLAAARTFDPAQGGGFPAHARQAVRWAVGRLLARSRRLPTPDDPAALDRVAAPDPPADRPPVPGWLRLGLARLPARQRRVLACYYGLDGEVPTPDGGQVASRLGLTPSAVRALHRRAVRSLRAAGGAVARPRRR